MAQSWIQDEGRSVNRARARSALAVLSLVGVFNLMDRQILAILLEPIRLETKPRRQSR